VHIFEERYKELIAGCEATGGVFGLVLSDDEGMRTIGTRASVDAVLERFDDGSSNIVVMGGERFAIEAFTEGRSFATARVRPYEDDPVAGPPADIEVARCREAFARLAAVAGGQGGTPDDDAPSPAFDLAGRIAFGADAKQELLELRSERARVRRVTELIESAEGELRRRASIRALAEGDGHVRDG
jgi:Lon protease-like protein